jgi:hypothetical protein
MQIQETNKNIWDLAYENTISIEIGFYNFQGGCKNCNSTKYKDTTREMQMLGNQMQRIVICECKRYFIEEW